MIRTTPLKKLVLSAALAISTATGAQAIDIVWVYDDADTFFTSERRAVMDMVADEFSRFTIASPNIGRPSSGTWDWSISNPNTGGTLTISDGVINAGTLIVYLGSRPLSGSTVGLGGPAGYSYSGVTFDWANQVNSLNTEDHFRPFAGSISFSSTADWYDGIDDTVTAGQIDFFSVAAHELLHVLGFGISSADRWEALTSTGSFTGSNAMALYGGAIPLNADAGHFAFSDYLMSAAIGTGERRFLSDLEAAMLVDMGYIAAPIPEPATLGFVFTGAGILLVAARRRSQQA